MCGFCVEARRFKSCCTKKSRKKKYHFAMTQKTGQVVQWSTVKLRNALFRMNKTAQHSKTAVHQCVSFCNKTKNSKLLHSTAQHSPAQHSAGASPATLCVHLSAIYTVTSAQVSMLLSIVQLQAAYPVRWQETKLCSETNHTVS